MNRNVYVNGIWHIRVTTRNYLNLLETNNVECIYECHGLLVCITIMQLNDTLIEAGIIFQ